jgi:hypothetical protein
MGPLYTRAYAVIAFLLNPEEFAENGNVGATR